MRRMLLAAAFVIGGTVLTGCGGGYYVVAAGPPAPRYGVVGFAPGPGYVWTEGFYDYRGGAWAWSPGAARLEPSNTPSSGRTATPARGSSSVTSVLPTATHHGSTPNQPKPSSASVIA